eukprot:TRINITY_DN11437_c1_g1_i1.p1 TRINITY_DN11437_c1_g1~~TRINITY_DN11437_c1_g1_i1.p1  ORF type:complete len:627 (+),score=137.43 TRINITY_DN11437_c1_g1_i1:108-1988(+)
MTKVDREAEEREMVVKVTSNASIALASIVMILCCISLALPWWQGKNAGKLIKVGLDGTETPMESSISLWNYDLKLLLAPEEGKLVGKEHTLQSTWDDMCATAEKTMAVPPGECLNIKLIRAFLILAAIFSSVAAMAIAISRRLTPLLLLLGVVTQLLAGLFLFAATMTGVMTSTTGLTIGFLMTMGSFVLAAAATSAMFYASTKAMPALNLGEEDVHVGRLQRIREARQKANEQRMMLEASVEERKMGSSKDSDAPHSEGDMDSETGMKRKVPVALQKVIFWSQDEENGEEDIPMYMLEAAYREIDEDGSGSCTMEELVSALALCGLHASQEAADMVMKDIDKNMDGTIDIHEFVEFFRTIEEMSRFQNKAEKRAQFLAFVCNFCFLAHIIIVGVDLMLFIRMDQAADPDNYAIMRNLLIAFSCILGLLFLSVIAIPAIRLTLGPNIAAWKYHYVKQFGGGRKKIVIQNSNSGPDPRSANKGIRGAAWAEGGGIAAPNVNAALYGSSYRVNRAALGDNTGDMFDNPAPFGRPPSGHGRPQSGKSGRTESSKGGGSVYSGGGNQVTGIQSADGQLLRYNPNMYRQSMMNNLGNSRAPMTFSPMQVHNLATSSDDPDSGMMAITAGNQ